MRNNQQCNTACAMSRKGALQSLLLIGALALPLLAGAQSNIGIPALNATPAPGGGTNYTLPLQTMLLMTALSFIPAALLEIGRAHV